MVVAPALRAPDLALSYDDDLQLQEPGWSAYGHTGIITTASQLARWGDQYREGDIVEDDFAVGAVDEPPGELYAAGIDIEADGDLNHTGRWGGYISEFTVSEDPDDDGRGDVQRPPLESLRHRRRTLGDLGPEHDRPRTALRTHRRHLSDGEDLGIGRHARSRASLDS